MQESQGSVDREMEEDEKAELITKLKASRKGKVKSGSQGKFGVYLNDQQVPDSKDSKEASKSSGNIGLSLGIPG